MAKHDKYKILINQKPYEADEKFITHYAESPCKQDTY